MRIITIDFETLYSKDYSLSKMQTDAYILDPRFEVILVAVKVDDEPTQWFSGDETSTGMWLAQFDFASSAVLCHNTLFDGFILEKRFGLRAKLWMDTLAMGRRLLPWLPSHSLAALAKHHGLQDKGTEVMNAIGKRRADFNPQDLQAYADYCCHDVALTHQLGKLFLPRTDALELKLIDMTVRMFTEPMFVGDQALLAKLHQGEIARKQALLDKFGGDKSVLMSNPKMAEELRKLGVEPPMKISAKTGKEAFAFAKSDKEFTALLDHPDPDVATLVEARLGVKTTIAETRALKFVEMSQRGPLAVYLNYWGAKTTGRYAGGNSCNFQNLSARGPSAGIRMAICAPPGHVVVVGDSSNIELRTVMAGAGQLDVVDKLVSGVDLYCDFAGKMYGRTITKADKTERMMGKLACLAEGTLVLTSRGEVPIEQVTIDDAVWDGVEWVSHAGVIYKGEKDVIEFDGIRATPEHLVCLETGAWCQLQTAAHMGARVARTGDGRKAVRFMDYCVTGTGGQEAGACILPVRVREFSLDDAPFSPDRALYPMQGLRGADAASQGGAHATAGGARRGSVWAGGSRAESMPESKRQGVSSVRWEGHRIQICLSRGVRWVCEGAARLFSFSGSGSDRQQRALRTRQPEILYTEGANSESAHNRVCGDAAGAGVVGRLAEPVLIWENLHMGGTTQNVRAANNSAGADSSGREAEKLAGHSRPIGRVRVYDIVDAGPRHCFTANGRLVHNCLGLQYGASWVRFKEMVRLQAGIVLPDAEAERVVTLYRHVHHKVVDMWEAFGERLIPDMATGGSLLPADHFAWCLTSNNGFGVAAAPGVVYHDLRQEVGTRLGKPAMQWMYQAGRQRTKLYSSKAVENWGQYVARMIVMWQTARINQLYPVKLSVHDEVCVITTEAKAADAAAYMEECLSMAPPWCRGHIPLACEVGIGPTYGSAK